MSYILAQEVDVNARDTKGLTPLHLAVKAAEDLRSSRSIRHLLIKGADRNLADNEGRLPIQMAMEVRTDAMKFEIIKLLEENDSFMMDCFMLKTPMKK
mmetsp:Transcript_25656/g.19407  ORF Transcript_25656/g.19407 Transcript_25656/m.19407 type:complete len:98 (+) Transcript_25656:618-911(+)